MTINAYTFHHVGIATKDLTETYRFIEQVYPIVSKVGPLYDKNLGAELFLLNVEGAAAIELVCGPAVQGVLKRGNSLYHVCYEVDDIEAIVHRQKYAGALVIVPPRPALLFEGRRVSFVHSPIGLIEFLERAPMET